MEEADLEQKTKTTRMDRWQSDGGQGCTAPNTPSHYMLLWCTYTHSKCQSYDILNVPFKGESQLNLSQGCTVRLLILRRLSSKQIYVVER